MRTRALKGTKEIKADRRRKKKLKPRGKPFQVGNQVARKNSLINLRKNTVKLNEFKNAIKYIADEGLGIGEACEKAGITQQTFYNIKNLDPELGKVYYEALKRRNDRDVERVRQEVMSCDKENAFPAKIKTEFIKWISAKLNPERYGDVDQRPPVNLEIKIGNELVQVKGPKK